MRNNILGLRSRNGKQAAVSVLILLTLLLVPFEEVNATASGLPKTSIITGPVSECGETAISQTPRAIEIFLHVLPSKRTIATYTVKPSTHVSFYAFAVTKGTYYLTTSQSLSKPPRGNIVITAASKSVITATISTVCQ
jgi:hypothetical protein